MGHSEIEERMKQNYEFPYRIKLTRRMPVIIRIDGKAFHTFTRGFKKPFDTNLIFIMQNTCKFLCENIQGCVLGYIQSDEISLLLVDYQKETSQGWFDYNLQKMVSVSASLATLEFNKRWREVVSREEDKECKEYDSYLKAYYKGACFDSRAFNIPKEEVVNYFYGRQLDCIRNSVAAVGQTYFSAKELNQKGTAAVKEMLNGIGVDWDYDFSRVERYGSCCVKGVKCWVIDYAIPVFKG